MKGLTVLALRNNSLAPTKTRNRFAKWAVLLVMAGLVAEPRGQAQVAGIDRLYDHYNTDAHGRSPGVAVLVIQNGQVIHCKGYGHANFRTKKKIDSQTQFNLASNTKAFTAAAALALIDDQKIHLDDSIRLTLPELPEFTADIRIADLIFHSSGLPEYAPNDTNNYWTLYKSLGLPFDPAAHLDNSVVVDFVKRASALDFAPHLYYRYCNTDYVLLAEIIERVSGQSFATFLSERILTPLQMNSTLFYTGPHSIKEHRAFGYSVDSHGIKKFDQGKWDTVHGDGGLYSSLDDLRRWVLALENDGLPFLKNQHGRIFTPGSPSAEPPVPTDYATEHNQSSEYVSPAGWGYAFGWEVTETHQGEKMISHDGGWVGFENTIHYLPKEKLWVVLLSNIAQLDQGDEAEAIFAVLRHPIARVTSAKPSTVETKLRRGSMPNR